MTFPRDKSQGFFGFLSRSRIPQILNLSSGPRPRLPGAGPPDPGDPVPDADPCLGLTCSVPQSSPAISQLKRIEAENDGKTRNQKLDMTSEHEKSMFRLDKISMRLAFP